MLYANLANTDKAITAYEQVVELYPNSEEARTAIESLQTLYVDKNDIEGYIITSNASQNLLWLYCRKHKKICSALLPPNAYLSKPTTKNQPKHFKIIWTNIAKHRLNCISAIYYLAESYYQTDQKRKRWTNLKIDTIDGNPYLTEALSRAAELAYAWQTKPLMLWTISRNSTRKQTINT